MKTLIIATLLVPTLTFGQTYLGETVPVQDAEIFAPGRLSAATSERDFAITADGKEIYYSLVTANDRAKIVCQKLVNGVWQPAEPLSFSGPFHDIEPALSYDGNKLFFSSSRNMAGDGTKDHDIWVSTRTQTGWSTPVNIGAPVNTIVNEYYPSVAISGTLYWTAAYTGGAGDEDIWYSTNDGSGYSERKLLPFNSSLDEFNAFVDPEEKFIFYSIFNRGDDVGHGDLYMSTKGTNGEFSGGAHLDFGINSTALDYSPYVTPDQKYLFFTSERTVVPPASLPSDPFSPSTIARKIGYPKAGSNIYWISFDKVKP